MVTVVVDAANVMGSRPDGWWKDRAGAAVRLYRDLRGLAARGAVVPAQDGHEGHEGGLAGFVLVLEGAARGAVKRLSDDDPAAAPVDVAAGEGALGEGVTPGEVRVVLAAGSGDDAIVAVVRELPGQRVVVTADRELRRRCAALGASVLGPGWLLGQFGA